MGKKAKKLRKACRAWSEGGGTGMPPWMAAGGAPAGWNAAGNGAASGLMPAWLRAMSAQQQFLVGLAIGAGGAWLLGDDERRAALVKAGMKLYTGLAGGFEELKEQVADIRAEMDAEQHGTP
ncbi:hypothetical protein CLD22_03210 [Rubrivivax gelatinosus]|nr:hypothetical protein [Rubrivivax gelatinosus]